MSAALPMNMETSPSYCRPTHRAPLEQRPRKRNGCIEAVDRRRRLLNSTFDHGKLLGKKLHRRASQPRSRAYHSQWADRGNERDSRSNGLPQAALKVTHSSKSAGYGQACGSSKFEHSAIPDVNLRRRVVPCCCPIDPSQRPPSATPEFTSPSAAPMPFCP